MNFRILLISMIFISLVIFSPITGITDISRESSSLEEEFVSGNVSQQENSQLKSSKNDKLNSKLSINEAHSSETNISYVQDDDETISLLNSSFYKPGDVISVNTTSTHVDESGNLDWSTEGYNNSYYYSLVSPQGQVWYNSSLVEAKNNTLTGLSDIGYTYKSQLLNSTSSSNFTSYKVFPDENFLKRVSFLGAVNITPTVVKISFQTVGKAIGTVSYSNTNGNFTDSGMQISDRTYINGTHTIYLRDLQPKTPYYFVINSTDIFGNYFEDINNGTYYSFTTSSADNDPFIQTLDINPSALGATIDIFVANPQSANATIFYSNNFANLANSANSISATPSTNPQVQIDLLEPATRYFFRVQLTNIDGNTTIDNNDGKLFMFTTNKATGAPDINSSILAQQINQTHFSISFTTSEAISSSIHYGLSLDLVQKSPSITSWGANSTSHYHIIPTAQVTTTFFGIRLSSNNATNRNFNNSLSQYYTYNSEPFTDVPQNNGFINITLDLPLYPAELGNWSLSIYIAKNNTETNAITNLQYQIIFLINDSLSFVPERYLFQRGQVQNNSETFGNFVIDSIDENTILSPGDNVSVVGQLKYSDGQPINYSEIGISGYIFLLYENESISIDGKILTLPVTSFKIFPNLTDLYNDNPLYYMLNFQIPNENIYGKVTIQTTVQFPGNQSFSNPGYNQTNNFKEITVQYLLGISNPPDQDQFFYTERLAGNITITPYHWNSSLFNQNQYASNNYSRPLNIPQSEIDVEVVITDPSNEVVNILEIQKGENNWFWLRQHLDFSLKSGTYTLNFNWENRTRTLLPLVDTQEEIGSFDQTAPEYNYSFTILSSYGIFDLTKNLVTRPGKTINLRFKLVVPKTNISVPINYKEQITVEAEVSSIHVENNLSYSQIKSEYSIPVMVSAELENGVYTLVVNHNEFPSLATNTLKFTVDDSIDDPITDTETTPGLVDKSLSFSNILFIGAGFLALGIYVLVIVIYLRKR